MGSKHPDYRRKAYKAWHNMKSRCLNPTHKKYPRYGGRGITICHEWRDSFEAFYQHIGDPPSPAHSLDRIDNNGNYEPGNVRWATSRQQGANTGQAKQIKHRQIAYRTMTDAARAHGMSKSALHRRLSRGWSLHDALTKPLQARSK